MIHSRNSIDSSSTGRPISGCQPRVFKPWRILDGALRGIEGFGGQEIEEASYID
jgi:hypothetical protein